MSPEEDRAVMLRLVALAHQSRRDADDLLRLTVREAHDAGATWGEIGEVLGVTKQAAWERFRA